MSGPLFLLDWGIGGLSVYRAVKAAMPGAACVYFSDSGAVPYGRQSEEELVARLQQILSQARSVWGVSRAVIACNAASTALPRLAVPGMRVTGVIEPGLALLRENGSKKAAVIGGQRTIESRLFSSRLAPFGLEITERVAQPLSALIERGELVGPRLDACLDEILAPLLGAPALLLACTHYPAVAGAIAARMPGTTLLDPAQRTAAGLAAERGTYASGPDLFVTSGDVGQTTLSAARAFGVQWVAAPLPEGFAAG